MHEKAIDLMRQKGLKPTHQRLAVYATLMSSRAHLSAQQIYVKVKKRHPTISLNTVYNTLDALKEAGLVGSVKMLHDESVRFDPTVEPHHHIVCMKCKAVVDLFDEKLLKIPTPDEVRNQFKITGYRVEFYGYCRNCTGGVRGE